MDNFQQIAAEESDVDNKYRAHYPDEPAVDPRIALQQPDKGQESGDRHIPRHGHTVSAGQGGGATEAHHQQQRQHGQHEVRRRHIHLPVGVGRKMPDIQPRDVAEPHRLVHD